MEKLLRDGRTLYNKPKKFRIHVHTDVLSDYRDISTDNECYEYAEQIKEAVNNYDTLKEENTSDKALIRRLQEENNNLRNVLGAVKLSLKNGGNEQENLVFYIEKALGNNPLNS